MPHFPHLACLRPTAYASVQSDNPAPCQFRGAGRKREDRKDEMVKVPGVARGKKLFYGWVIVLGGFISQMITGIKHQGFSTYLPLLEEEFGWSKALLSAPRAFSLIETAILGPINGYLADR